jgi:hypothetical protein
MALQEEIQRASVIVMAQATSVTATQRLAETPDRYKWVLRLIQVNISVENVLKGEVSRPNLTFYCYYPEYGYDGPPLNLIGPTTRGIFFLQQDQNVYRSVNDVSLTSVF